ncbi:13843_t:CDS:2, partial [Acaulospora morrowiae]
MSRIVPTPEQVGESNHSNHSNRVTFDLPKGTTSPSRTPSVISVSSLNFTLKQPHYHPLHQPSWREQLAVELDNSAIGSIWKLVDAFINILLCAIYIANTAHLKKELPLFNVCFEAVMAILLLMEYIPKFYIYEFETWGSLFTRASPILTALTVSPVFVAVWGSVIKEARYVVFFYPFRFIRCYLSVYDCLVRSEKSVLRLGQVTSRVLIFLVSILFLVLTSSSLLHGVEYAYMATVFFTTIMLGTVGYLSDIVPDNAFPRILLMVIFITGLIFIPYYITELTSLIRSKSVYDKPFRKISQQPHVIIIAPTIELPSLRHFLKEFYSLAHGSATFNTKVVILNSTDPTERVKTFLSDPVYAHRVQYIRGSPLDARSLEKSNARNASAYFILAKKFTQQSEIIDAENVLRAIALRKFNVGPKLYIQCILPENKVHFESLNPEQVICTDELKLAILAHSCLTPGLSALLYGLITSFTYESLQDLRSGKKNSSFGFDSEIIEDYVTGFSQSIYTTTISDHFSGRRFLSVAECLYDSLGVVLFAIGIPKQRSFNNNWMLDYSDEEENEDSKNYMVLINPGDYIVKGDEIGFIIASNGALIDGVSSYEWQSSQSRTNLMPERHMPSEKHPLLAGDKLKNIGGGNYDTKKPTISSDHQHYDYPHRPDSSTLRRHRALSTPLSFSVDYPHDLASHDYSAMSSNLPSSHTQDIEHSLIDSIVGHILLCDYSPTLFPRNLDCFVSPLRKSYLEKITPIIILSPVRPSQSQWKILSQFDQVYFVQGNPMTREGLENGRVRYAKQAVSDHFLFNEFSGVLLNINMLQTGDPDRFHKDIKVESLCRYACTTLLNLHISNKVTSCKNRNGEKAEDASSMLVFLNIKAMCKEDIDVFVEFVHMDNMKFMSEDTSTIDQNMQPHLSPAFMTGTCISLSMLDSIICQSFYQPHLVSIVEQMLFGAPPLHLPSGATCPAPAHSHIFQIPVPRLFVGYQYSELFRFLLSEKKSIPLGLYRAKRVRTSSGHIKEMKYVYTCPKHN